MEQYECNICGASFETVQQLKNHFSIHQDENKEEENDPSNEAEDDDPLMKKELGNALKVSLFILKVKRKLIHYNCLVTEKKILPNILRMQQKEEVELNGTLVVQSSL